jgi:hypothetical protein
MSMVYIMTRTPALPGRRRLAVDAREWERMANAIGRVMKLA